MIDLELADMTRELVAAYDRLNSEDFQARQIRLQEVEIERQKLAVSLEEDERAVLEVQKRIQDHVLKGKAGPAITHASDCALHNAPAFDPKEYDCHVSGDDKEDEFSCLR